MAMNGGECQHFDLLYSLEREEIYAAYGPLDIFLLLHIQLPSLVSLYKGKQHAPKKPFERNVTEKHSPSARQSSFWSE
jgi:hypothetical protein